MVAKVCWLLATAHLKKNGGGKFTEEEWLPIQPPKGIRQQSEQEVESILSQVLGPHKKDTAKKPIKPKKKK